MKYVSILILLEVILEVDGVSWNVRSCVVSILILLEVILEEHSSVHFNWPHPGFNPYFTGSNSGSKLCVHDNLCLHSFNPYFTGSNSGRRAMWTIWWKFYCFNPYFTGSNSGRGDAININFINHSFQSLFYWK